MQGQLMIVEQFKAAFRTLSSQTIVQLPSIYRDDIVFVDPVHRVHGLPELQCYFTTQMENLARCEFAYDAQTITADSACICWNMHFQHPALKRGASLSLRGISRICFDDRIYYHEDFYDLGAMLYEHVPVLGCATRYLKRRLAS
jgi:limonene-1,2-epoxide hydrolase